MFNEAAWVSKSPDALAVASARRMVMSDDDERDNADGDRRAPCLLAVTQRRKMKVVVSGVEASNRMRCGRD